MISRRIFRDADFRSAVRGAPAQSHVASARQLWLFSRRADFWLASGGASLGLVAAMGLILVHSDRELDALDFVLSEFHLGATYGTIMQRRLWHHRRTDVLLVPLVILVLAYVLSMSGHGILLTSIAMYGAVWHRGRQSLGVARFYQRKMVGPISPAHNILFRGAIYLPMLAATIAYNHLAPMRYEGDPYFALDVGAATTTIIGVAALCWVVAYLIFTGFQNRNAPATRADQSQSMLVHPGEYWVVLAHAIAFGSAYALGASNASFILVLAVHHEVQYLYFTYAMASQPEAFTPLMNSPADLSMKSLGLTASPHAGGAPRRRLQSAATFLVWPVAGFVGAVVGSWLQLKWLAPLGLGGLFCHYWLDGRIWIRRSFQR